MHGSRDHLSNRRIYRETHKILTKRRVEPPTAYDGPATAVRPIAGKPHRIHFQITTAAPRPTSAA